MQHDVDTCNMQCYAEGKDVAEGTFSAALDEQAISHLHDVSLVHCCDLVTAIVTGILKGVLSDPCTGNSCDDL